MSVGSDVPADLRFVDPCEADDTWRVVLWAAPGQGKSVAAASAPDPIVVLSADRPGAYRYARRHHSGKDIRETRYASSASLAGLYRYLRDHPEVKTVVIDPFHNIYDKLVDEMPNRAADGEPDWQGVNKKALGFLYSLRDFDVNVILVAHEKLSDGKKGDGKLYPQLGGPALINKIMAESDIVARVSRDVADDGTVAYMGQLQPVGNLVCKESTGALGDRRPLDLSEWFAVANAAAEGDRPDTSDIPFSDDFDPNADNETLDQAMLKAEGRSA